MLFVYPQSCLRFKLWAPIRPFPCWVTSVGTEGGGGHGIHFLYFKAGGYWPQPPKQGADPCLFDHMAREREVIRSEKTLLWVRTCMISLYSSMNPLLVQKICVNLTDDSYMSFEFWLDRVLKGTYYAKSTFIWCLYINVCWKSVNTTTLQW